MHPLYEKADAASKDVYVAALEVRRVIGNGTMLEKVYQKCLQHELQLMGHKAEMEQPVRIFYKDKVWEENLRIDILVDDCLVVECKAIEGDKVDMEKFKAQTLTYLKLTNLPLGMVINFGSEGFGKRGVHRVILKGASDRANEGQTV